MYGDGFKFKGLKITPIFFKNGVYSDVQLKMKTLERCCPELKVIASR